MCWWFRLWHPNGPGLALYNERVWVPFSIRYKHVRYIRIGRWFVTFIRRF